MTEAALVSVIIPVYNGAQFLPEAVASVRAQAYAPIEIILVDDGSTDHTAQVVQTLGADLRYVYQPNRGVAAARNHGLALAQGELIAFLDVDDLWPAQKLTQQIAALSAEEEIQMVWGMTWDQPYQGFVAPTVTDQAVLRLTSCLGSLLCRKEVFDLVGSFDESLLVSEDLDWIRRVQEKGIRVKQLPEPGLIYRRRPGSLTFGKPRQEMGWLPVIKALLARRRTGEQTNHLASQG